MTSSSRVLRVRLNVTRGAVRSVFLKLGSCPILPADISGEQCLGYCHMTWYVYFDRFTGIRRYLYQNATQLPTGSGKYPDKRAVGDWFVSVQVLLRTSDYPSLTSHLQIPTAHYPLLLLPTAHYSVPTPLPRLRTAMLSACPLAFAA